MDNISPDFVITSEQENMVSLESDEITFSEQVFEANMLRAEETRKDVLECQKKKFLILPLTYEFTIFWGKVQNISIKDFRL